MPSRKPVPAVLPWLAALSAASPVLMVAAVAATRFGGVDLAVSYDLLTWTVARVLAWAGLAGAFVAVVIALRDLKGGGLYALVALALSGATVAGFLWQAQQLAQDSPRDVATNLAEPPPLARAVSTPAGPEACPAAQPIPTQILAQQATSALVDAGFQVTRASTFEVQAVHEGAWFGFAQDAVVRIRPGRTDVRIAARSSRPDGGATCRLMGKLVAALKENAG